MQVTRRLKPSEVNANYSALPKDINSYIDDSVMAKQPEIDLWEFMKTRPDKLYEEWAYEVGSDLTTEYKAVPLTKLDIDENNFFKFMQENKDTCQKKYYERRPYHNGRSELTENFPMKCGYNEKNTVEYNWGLYGDSNQKVKDLLGTRKVWEEQIGIDYDTALIRLLCYMPGMILPWHHDNLGNWCRNNKHLNPNIDTQMCDLGPIKRYLVMINDWHWGHIIQMNNSYFPKWKSGEMYDLPMPQPHCSANIGMRIKLTCSISGAKIK
jgi:hypothetical protein